MAVFNINGEKEPFLIVQLEKGEKIFAESDSMMAMQDSIEIKGEARGGFLASIGRAITSGEDLFQQTITATQDAVVMLSPSLPGDIKILKLSPNKGYFLNDYAFFTAEDGINLETRRNQNIGSSLFSGDGFFVLYAGGNGSLVINGLGSIEEIEISDEGGDLIVDNGHLLAWEEGISYTAEVVNSGSSGFLGRAINSITSGEGMVMRLKGTGKIYVASRNLGTFKSFISGLSNNTDSNSGTSLL